MMKLKILSDNLAQVNTYLLYKKNQLVIIDPGFNGPAISDFVAEKALEVTDIILTHGHFDHIKSIEKLAKDKLVKLYINHFDLELLKDEDKNYAKAFSSSFKLPETAEIIDLHDNSKLMIFDEVFEIMTTPGHTKGSVCVKYANNLFTGDTLFYNSVGRTDLYSGNMNDLNQSLLKLLNKVGNSIMIYPGHGNFAKFKEVKSVNPYIKW